MLGLPCTKDSLCPWKAIIQDNVNTGTKNHCSALVKCYLLNDKKHINSEAKYMTLYVSLSSCVLLNDFRLPEMVA